MLSSEEAVGFASKEMLQSKYLQPNLSNLKS